MGRVGTVRLDLSLRDSIFLRSSRERPGGRWSRSRSLVTRPFDVCEFRVRPRVSASRPRPRRERRVCKPRVVNTAHGRDDASQGVEQPLSARGRARGGRELGGALLSHLPLERGAPSRRPRASEGQQRCALVRASATSTPLGARPRSLTIPFLVVSQATCPCRSRSRAFRAPRGRTISPGVSEETRVLI